MVLCWNLMCPSCNVVSLCYSHLGWKDDALGIYFAHMKIDQFGERPKEARHIYANPLMPEICPISALGLYHLCVPPEQLIYFLVKISMIVFDAFLFVFFNNQVAVNFSHVECLGNSFNP